MNAAILAALLLLGGTAPSEPTLPDKGELMLARMQAEEEAEATPEWLAPVPEQPAPPPTPAPPPAPASSVDWDAVGPGCETYGLADPWGANTGNGYWGGLQFKPSTWFAYGGGPFDGSGRFPYSRAEQIAVAERVLAGQGADAWPNCF